VRQHDPHGNRWNDISFYNESGNFLGPAIFNTKQRAQEYFDMKVKCLRVWQVLRTLSLLLLVAAMTRIRYENKKNQMMIIKTRIMIREEKRVKQNHQK
jgi:hypothetical protein